MSNENQIAASPGWISSQEEVKNSKIFSEKRKLKKLAKHQLIIIIERKYQSFYHMFF